MFFQFFDELRSARIPVTLKEYLALMDALDKHVIDLKVDEFYYLSRTALVKTSAISTSSTASSAMSSRGWRISIPRRWHRFRKNG